MTQLLLHQLLDLLQNAAALMAKSTAAAAAANARTTTVADDPSAEATGSEHCFQNSKASSKSQKA